MSSRALPVSSRQQAFHPPHEWQGLSRPIFCKETWMQIKDLLKRDLRERIEEVIKLSQDDEETVYTEITEYVATERIQEHYRTLLRAIAEAPAEPHEGIGVWVSGFFGSGKSSFAKNLGYVLDNRSVLGHLSADLFKQQVQDEEITRLVDFITLTI